MGAFTVDDLREALKELPGHLPISIHVEMEHDGDLAEVDEIVTAIDAIVSNVKDVGRSLVIRM